MRRLIVPVLFMGLMLGLAVAGLVSLRAQSGTQGAVADPAHSPREPSGANPRTQSASIQESLLKPFAFRFARPTPLADVVQMLNRELGSPVVLDRAALDRLDVKPDDTVQLELHGVRLKTGLKLLLDQLGLTYKVVAEDNLLILTDRQGSEDPIERVMAEVHELHRDIHDIQDALDEVRELMGLADEEGAKVRKPTIIEELPEKPEGNGPVLRPPSKPPTQSDPAPRPSAAPVPRPRTRL